MLWFYYPGKNSYQLTAFSFWRWLRGCIARTDLKAASCLLSAVRCWLFAIRYFFGAGGTPGMLIMPVSSRNIMRVS